MKDPRFIELLNLYVDQEISSEDSRELETEIRTNPDRHAVYQQYCRMHRACSLLHDQHETQAADVVDGVIDFPASRARRWMPVLGGLAVAACLTLVVLRTNHSFSPSISLAAGVAEVSAPSSSVAAISTLEKEPATFAADTPVSMPSTNRSTDRIHYTLSSVHYAANSDSTKVVSFSPTALDWLGPLPSAATPSFIMDGKKRNESPSANTWNSSLNSEVTAFQFSK